MNSLTLAMALSNLPPKELALDFFGQSVISSERSEMRQQRTSGKSTFYMARDKGSRIGVRFKSDSEKVDGFGVIEVGIRIPDNEIDSHSLVYLRESSIGVEAGRILASMGFGNSIFKLSQLSVDRFNDIYDMKSTITGESVHRYVRVTSRFNPRYSASVSVFRPGESQNSDTSGYALSYIYEGSLGHASFSVESRSGEVKRARISLVLSDLRCAPGALFQRDHIDSTAETFDAVLLSTNCRHGQFGFRAQYVLSELLRPDVDLAMELQSSISAAIGFDFYFSKDSRFFAYVGSTEWYSDNQFASTSEVNSTSYGAGLELRL